MVRPPGETATLRFSLRTDVASIEDGALAGRLRGQAFTVTRDGHRIGELIPLRRRRRFVTREQFATMSRGVSGESSCPAWNEVRLVAEALVLHAIRPFKNSSRAGGSLSRPGFAARARAGPGRSATVALRWSTGPG